MSCEHEHHHSHGDDDQSHIPLIPTSSVQNLREYIDFTQLRALNVQQRDDELQKVFRPSDDRFRLSGFIESDADCQMLLNIPFTGNVKLYSLIIRSDGEEHCPKTIKLFKNDKTLDFDNVNDKKPTFKFEHPLLGVMDDSLASDPNEDSFIEHHLPRSQFQSTYHLTIFVQDQHDDEDESTKMYYIELRGIFTNPLSKDPVIALYESAANPADHKNLLQQEVGYNDIN
jgi:hypothetical protein